MSTVMPFPDLNLMPDSQSSTAGTTAGDTVVTGNLEVKAEPVEELQTPPSSTSDQSASNDHLIAEFIRISKLFRSAFKPWQVEGLDGVSVYGLDAGAIVAVPDEEDNRGFVEPPPGLGVNRDSPSVAVSSPPKTSFERPRELARVTILGHDQRKQLRQLVKQTRMIYECLRVQLIADQRKSPLFGKGRRGRSDMIAASMMKAKGLWLNYEKHIVGPVAGVEIGDVFFYRMELCVVGLHGQQQAGIDCLTTDRSATKEPIATSIIVSGGYEDDEDQGDVLVYTGHGGQDKQHRQCEDQKLVGGNLGMERSMYYGIEVRVIRGIKYENSVTSKVYVYDGLYKIVDCWFAVGKSGYGVFKFRLVRMEGQPRMASAVMRDAQTLRLEPLKVRPHGYVSLDISNKKENVCVFLYNDIDGDQEPMHYEYIAKSIFPPGIFGQGGGINRTGCDCTNSCTDDCLCARKNGGEFAYDDNGHLLRGKHVVFECGNFCKCGPGCKSRVTQKGLRKRLEVFRSKDTCWSVRTLDLIEAGSFICEYAGVVVTRHQAEILSMNGDVMVYPGRFTDQWANWGDLSQVYPGYVKPNYPTIPPLDFAMDVSKMRNVACYISHSKEPNVMVQFVLYDHNHLSFPRVMLFATENISPMAELSMDYGLADEVTGKLAICN
ncbi:PREDICTED: histone-lysine N-methyltransferase family member SUVH2-like [Camelina sativa]|uniref:Histone-lysine N-methyltransferase family member SUVH2-like n=1 Tax=Camelina sativa TaxID=90675 RepID=A0ABM0SNP1_CAMSA|nr:PREDICTED: histone-lysine N-methyltransferase family member SUVH2-like [Camelina sativa]